MNVVYEWDRETIDEHGDIVDHNHADKLSDIINDEGVLVLVRDECCPESGSVEDRQWAYVSNGKLPEYFAYAGIDGPEYTQVRVPKRFHQELRRLSQ